MIRLALIRHARTEWNDEGRIQGRDDQKLSAEGRAELAHLLPPLGFETARLIASPLERAIATAETLFGRAPEIDTRLIEMDWGRFTGRLKSEMQAEIAAAAGGFGQALDFRPPDGETPREVMARFRGFAAAIAADGRDTVALTHRGVIRAALALATGWDMTVKQPGAKRRDAAHVFAVAPDGTLTVIALDVALPRRPE